MIDQPFIRYGIWIPPGFDDVQKDKTIAEIRKIKLNKLKRKDKLKYIDSILKNNK